MLSQNSLAAFRRVPTPMLLVGSLHLVVLWALLNGFQTHNAAPPPPTDMTVNVIERPPPPVDKPLPPEVRPDEIKFTPPEIPVTVSPPPIDQVHTVADDLPPIPIQPERGAGSIEPQPVIAAAAVDPHHPLSQPPYPMSSRRVGEEGALFLDVLVGADGHVTDAKVSQSSGFERLDQAAMSEAKQHWRLRPATRNGVPFEQWLTLHVVFRLENR
jgi:protein TonB